MHHRTLQACRIPTTRGLSISADNADKLSGPRPGITGRRQKRLAARPLIAPLTVARGLGPGGAPAVLRRQREVDSIARAAWESAGVADRIELRVGRVWKPPLAAAGEQFDFAFIDACRTGYAQYHEQVLARLRPDGLMLLDNLLQGGHVVDDLADDEDVSAIRALNEAIAAILAWKWF